MSFWEHYVIIDFECTCAKEVLRPVEIIEFPSVIVDSETLEVVSEFHEYVRPVSNPTLTDFCTELTGITQKDVDSADTFPDVFKRYNRWLAENGCINFVLVTCGSKDFDSTFPKQCKLSGIKPTGRFSQLINIKKEFEVFYGKKARDMTDMLKLPLIGRHHSGLDDTRNITRVLVEMLKDGYSPDRSSLTVVQAVGTVKRTDFLNKLSCR